MRVSAERKNSKTLTYIHNDNVKYFILFEVIVTIYKLKYCNNRVLGT